MKKKTKDRILAFMPAYNEEKKIGVAVSRIPREMVDEILVVDDGSSDNTPLEAKTNGARVISNPTSMGVGNAIRMGIAYGRENGFSIMVILAGNNKDEPNEINKLTEPILNDGYDFIQGSRYLPQGGFSNMPFYRRLATQYIHPLFFSLFSGKKITDSTNGFRAIRLSIFDDQRINLGQEWLNQYELEPYIFFKAIGLGYKVKEVPVTKIYPSKEIGYTKMKPVTGWWSILRPIFYLGLRMKK